MRWSTIDDYVRASIIEPQAYVVPGYSAVMPSAETLRLSPHDAEDLVAYLVTLR